MQTTTAARVIVAAVVYCASSAVVAATPVSVFLLAGQSNMDGRADIADAPPQWALPQEDVLLYYSDTVGWVPLQYGATTDPGTQTMFGPELSYGRALADRYPDTQIALVKHSRGDTSLALDWNPDFGIEYFELVAKVALATAELELAGYEPSIRGMVWMQGESDAAVLYQAIKYLPNLRDFVAGVRAFVGNVEMPFVIGRINAPGYSFRYLVRDAQMNLALSDSSASMISTDDLSLLQDGVHYAAGGTIELGDRLAVHTIRLLEPTAIPTLGTWGLAAMTLSVLAAGVARIRQGGFA